MTAIFSFEVKGAKKNTFFKGLFLNNAWPCRYDFWRVFRNQCEASNKFNFANLFKI